MKYQITQKQYDNLLKSADFIETHEQNFTMIGWVCDSVMCIGGTAIMMNKGHKQVSALSAWADELPFGGIFNELVKATGFTKEHKELFFEDCWLKSEYTDAYIDAKSTYRTAKAGSKEETKAKKEMAQAAANYVRWYLENHVEVKI